MASTEKTTENISVRHVAGVAYLTLNRPQARNAMSLAMVDELINKLKETEKQGDSRIVVVRGAGGNFCAGADLKDMAAARARVQSGQMDAAEGGSWAGALAWPARPTSPCRKPHSAWCPRKSPRIWSNAWAIRRPSAWRLRGAAWMP